MESSKSKGPALKKPKLEKMEVPPNMEKPDFKIMIAAEDYEAFVKLITCPNCSKRYDTPVRICKFLGCVTCPHCHQSSNPGCNRCHTSFLSNDCVLNKMLQLFPVECTYTKQGCTERMKTEKIIIHEKICDYRNIHCFSCDNSVIFNDLNEHIYTHEDESLYLSNFGNHVKLEIEPQEKKFNGHFIIYIKAIQKFFLFKYTYIGLDDFQFGLYYIGKRNEASLYLYEIKIDQGLNNFFIQTAKCSPYSHESNMIHFSVSEKFLTSDYKSGFNMLVAIKPGFF